MSDRLDRWMDAYVVAWQSNEPDDIRELFADDAEYSSDPFVEPWRGTDEIVDNWIERQDDPGTWEFEWWTVVETETTAVVEGETQYVDGPTFSNLWIITFDESGRATEFVEWWMDQAEPSGAVSE